MAIVEINWQPSRTDLRVFGGGLVAFCAVIAWLCYRSDGHFGLLESSFAAVAVLAIVVLLFWPAWLRPIYFAFTVLTFPIGWVISHLLLAVVFYAVFTPIGLFMRWRGRDPMQRHWDSQAESYWVPHDSKKTLEDYFRQF